MVLSFAKLGIQEAEGIGKCSDWGRGSSMIQIWLGTGEATWKGDPVSASPGEELLLELVITHEILGYTDFHHSADLRYSSCSHHSEKRWKLGTVWWMFSCIRPVNVSMETNLTSAFCDSSSSLPVPPLPQDLCCLWPKGALVFVWVFFLNKVAVFRN